MGMIASLVVEMEVYLQFKANVYSVYNVYSF